jgi:hypothetical protein
MNNGVLVIVMSGLVWLGGCMTHTAIGGLSGSGGNDAQPGGGPGSGGHGGTTTCDAGAGSAPRGPAATLSFAPAVDYAVDASNASTGFIIAAGDLSGDGKVDVVAGKGLRIHVLINRGAGTFADPVGYATTATNYGYTPAIGDLDGDGKADVIVTSDGRVDLFTNTGGGVLAPPVTYVAGAYAGALAVADLDGDGKNDIVAAGGSDPSATVLFNTGGGTFAAKSYAGLEGGAPMTVGDVNGDCRPDIVATFAQSASGDNVGGLSVRLNEGHGTFAAPAIYGVGTFPSSIALGDLNGDGKSDIAAPGGRDGVGDLDVLLNYGDGTFTASLAYAPGPNPDGGTSPEDVPAAYAVALGDLDGDGRLDVAYVTPCCGAGVRLNRGDGTFGAPIYFGAPSARSAMTYLSSAAVADVNGDGKPDLILGFGTGVTVLLNTSH